MAKCLFVGGVADGRWIDVMDCRDEFYGSEVPTNGLPLNEAMGLQKAVMTQPYVRFLLWDMNKALCSVFVPVGEMPELTIQKLLKGYKP